MRVAVAGCCHGELDRIYETLALAERRGPGPIDLLLCCGDFQAVRNEADLRCMVVPPEYRHMQTFYSLGNMLTTQRLQVIEIEHDPSAPDYLEYDIEWLTILRATNSLVNVTGRLWNMPESNGLHARWDYSTTEETVNEVLEKLNHDLKVPSPGPWSRCHGRASPGRRGPAAAAAAPASEPRPQPPRQKPAR
ncbi:Lariat debranching enzyme [Manis javanica]|nr:Lariat debranching enzyme [Manis javanica]